MAHQGQRWNLYSPDSQRNKTAITAALKVNEVGAKPTSGQKKFPDSEHSKVMAEAQGGNVRSFTIEMRRFPGVT
jgi:hypothetical protein